MFEFQSGAIYNMFDKCKRAKLQVLVKLLKSSVSFSELYKTHPVPRMHLESLAFEIQI